MDEQTIQKLRLINLEFYQTFADPFSQTRRRIQPGVQKIMERIPPDASILDLGCGNGTLLHELIKQGYQGFYVGIDSSQELLEIARKNLASLQIPQAGFGLLDLTSPNWDRDLATILADCFSSPGSKRFNFILAFAVLHHLPGVEVRRNFLHQVSHFLVPDGLFIHSNWQFLNSSKLRKRILDWNVVGLTSQDVDSNDYLLDWRAGGTGIRYVHHFDEEELKLLAKEAGFSIIETFRSDGEDGTLGLYQIWQLATIQPDRQDTN